MAELTLANPDAENNRVAGAAVEALDQGDLVRVNANEEIVAADAADGLAGQAGGCLLTPVTDPTDPKYGDLQYVQNQLKEERNVLVGEGDRALGFINDVEVQNVDDDAPLGLTPGEPVYLAEGGGVTQTTPATSGSVVQIVGYAVEPEVFNLQIQYSDEIVA